MKLANQIVRFFSVCVIATPLLLTGGIAQAQDYSKEHLSAAKAAMLATGATDRLDAILPEVANFTKAGLIANRPDIESEISLIVDETAISLAERRGALENEVANIYAATFSEDELKQISEFFTSETGSKFLKTTSGLLQRVDQAASVWQSGINRDMSKMVVDKLEEKGLQ